MREFILNKIERTKNLKYSIFTSAILLTSFVFSANKVLAEGVPSVPLPPTGSSSYYIPFSFPVIGAVSANLDGDSVLDWVAKSSPWQTGTTKLEAKTLDGRLLWTFDTRQSNQETWAPNSFEVGAAHTAWDLDGDGIDEVFTTYWDGSKGSLVALNGKALNGTTGQIKSMIPLPLGEGNIGTSGFPPMMGAHEMAIGYLDGPLGKPTLLIEYGVYAGGAVWAFDWDKAINSLRHKWTYHHSMSYSSGTAGHYINTFDLNSDGREEVIMGGTILNPDGTKLFSLSDFAGHYGHVDIAAAGDINPDKPGYELFFAVESPECEGYDPNCQASAAMLTNWNGTTTYWSKPGDHWDAGYVANINPNSPGDEINVQEKGGSENGQKHILCTAAGSCSNVTDAAYRWKRSPEWTGDDVYDISVGGPGPGYNSFVCDVGGGADHGAEEIISLDGNASGSGWIEIKFNKTANSYASRWSNRHYRQDCATASSGHSNHGVYMVQKVGTPICDNFDYSDWSACQPNGKRIRTIVSRSPESCIPGEQILSEPCEYQFTCNEINPYGAYIEAENFTGTIARTTGTMGFTLGTSENGFFGEGYLNSGNANEGKEYSVYFPEAGEYSFWVRGFGYDIHSKSVFFGLDGTNIGILFYSGNDYGDWQWTNNGGTPPYGTGVNFISISEPGIHKVNIWKREEGYLVDGIYLTKKGNAPPDVLRGTTIDPRSCTGADVNSDMKVNIKDIQICIKGIIDQNSILSVQLQKCQAVALPPDVVNIKDIQGIIRKIINPN